MLKPVLLKKKKINDKFRKETYRFQTLTPIIDITENLQKKNKETLTNVFIEETKYGKFRKETYRTCPISSVQSNSEDLQKKLKETLISVSIKKEKYVSLASQRNLPTLPKSKTKSTKRQTKR